MKNKEEIVEDIKKQFKTVPIINITLPKESYVRSLDDKTFNFLYDSIKKIGMIAPIILFQHRDNAILPEIDHEFHIADGHNRLKILSILGETKTNAIIYTLNFNQADLRQAQIIIDSIRRHNSKEMNEVSLFLAYKEYENYPPEKASNYSFFDVLQNIQTKIAPQTIRKLNLIYDMVNKNADNQKLFEDILRNKSTITESFNKAKEERRLIDTDKKREVELNDFFRKTISNEKAEDYKKTKEELKKFGQKQHFTTVPRQVEMEDKQFLIHIQRKLGKVNVFCDEFKSEDVFVNEIKKSIKYNLNTITSFLQDS